MHGIGHADNEGKEGYDDERHEKANVHQLERTSPLNQLTLHSACHILPPFSQVPDATGGDIRRVKGSIRPFKVVQDPYARVRSPQ